LQYYFAVNQSDTQKCLL